MTQAADALVFPGRLYPVRYVIANITSPTKSPVFSTGELEWRLVVLPPTRHPDNHLGIHIHLVSGDPIIINIIVSSDEDDHETKILEEEDVKDYDSHDRGACDHTEKATSLAKKRHRHAVDDDDDAQTRSATEMNDHESHCDLAGSAVLSASKMGQAKSHKMASSNVVIILPWTNLYQFALLLLREACSRSRTDNVLCGRSDGDRGAPVKHKRRTKAIEKTAERTKNSFHWLGLSADVKAFVGGNLVCHKTKGATGLIKTLSEEYINNWDLKLDGVFYKEQTITKHSPFYLLYGREARYPSQIPELPGDRGGEWTIATRFVSADGQQSG
ncbi:Hypp2852 [Branchiostoma lanceolatum]|uniref:Hypp2852 protein n=1 Tax=Branchiostoma lanceolatum TaxID=7740 RepID=A0A8K0EVD1_BRALA|nr:Hypp2852 [Branchiostoma lanceolatum]